MPRKRDIDTKGNISENYIWKKKANLIHQYKCPIPWQDFFIINYEAEVGL